MEHSDMVNVTKTNLFPTSIYEFDAEITEQQRQVMLDYIQDKFENYLLEFDLRLNPFQ